MKKIIAAVICILGALCISLTVIASNSPATQARKEPVSAPSDSNTRKILVSTETRTYIEDGFIIQEEAKVYDVEPSTEKNEEKEHTKSVWVSKSVKGPGLGEVLSVSLKATFVYDASTGVVTCTNYDTVYDIAHPDLLLPPETDSDKQWETSCQFTKSGLGVTREKVTTTYQFEIKHGLGFQTTYTPSAWVSCTSTGIVGIG